MKLKEIFDALTYGELSQVSIGGGKAGEILESAYPRVLSHINLGLTALFKRFNLKEGRLKIELQPQLEVYALNSIYAVANPKNSLVKFIKDTADNRFMDDLVKVQAVFNDSGEEMPLNDKFDPLSITTPTLTSIRVPSQIRENLIPELATTHLDIVYQATHPTLKVALGYFDPARVEVALPQSHLQALLYFVASRAHAPIGMREEFNASNNFYAKYEAECQQLENDGNEIDQGGGNFRLIRNGWV